jgi:hypothetical protein
VIYARQVIERPSEFEKSMKIIDLLLAMPKVGRVKANKWLARAAVSPSKTLEGLTDRQRRELALIVGRYG